MTEGDEFFIGWSNTVGRDLRRFMRRTAFAIVGGFAGLSALLALSITDPARSIFGANAVPEVWQEVILSGILTSQPYPFLLTAPDASRPSGHGVMLSGDGKRAAAYDRTAFEGRRVEVKGLLIKRGSLDMLVVNSEPRLLVNEASIAEVAPKPMGRWRVIGEICDGKCGAGIMSPGTGIAHKACANLCVIGGVPPVLVTAHPLDGHQFLMISDGQGRPLDDTLLRFVGMRVEVEGEVELRGDVALMRIEPGRMRRL